MRLPTLRKKKGIAIALCALAVIATASLPLFRGQAPAASQNNNIVIGFARVNRPAPSFDLPKLDGHGTVQPSRLDGKPIVINFWSSTCTICKEESPAIAKVAHATQGSVNYLGIDTLDARRQAMAFVKKYGLTYETAYDAQGITASRYGVPGLPMTYFLSETGKRIIGVNTGALTAQSLSSILRNLYGSSKT